MATKTLFTVEEFLRLPEPMDEKYELVEGERVLMSPTMPLHNLVRDRLLYFLMAFLEGHKLGTVLAEQAFHLFGNTVRIPDISFVRTGRLQELRKLPHGAPDLAIEVLSPTNTPGEMKRRASDYFAGGCQRVWLVYPEDREVYIHGLSGVTRRGVGELLEDPELLPGFSVRVSSLFD
ncbi:MAG: Uma2 family endonuclease [Terriglobia bacterium]